MPINMECDGDSITAAASYIDAADGNMALDANGNGLYTRKLLPHLSFGVNVALDVVLTHNRAIPGSLLQDCVDRAAATKAQMAATGLMSIFTVNAGHNNYAQNTTAANYLTAYASYLDSMMGNPRVRVGVCTILPSTITGGQGTFNEWRGLVNTGIRTFAPSHCHFIIDLGDPATTMGADAAASDTDLYPDHIHPGRNEALGIVYAQYVNAYALTIPTSYAAVFRRF